MTREGAEVDRARCATTDLKSQNTKEFLGTECASVIKPGYNNDFEGLPCLSSGLSLLSVIQLFILFSLVPFQLHPERKTDNPVMHG